MGEFGMSTPALQNIVIAGYVRSPFQFAKKGDLARVRPDDLAAETIRQLIERTKLRAEDIEDLIVGCAFPEAEQGLNVARMIGLLADLPLNVAGMTVNRFCGSSMQSVHIAAGAIAAGMGEVFLCAGVESMSRVPMMGFNPLPNLKLAEKSPDAYISMGQTAENVAVKWQISRAEQEDFAVLSHAKAAEAEAQGRLSAEIAPIHINGHVVAKDGCIRRETTRETLASLKPAFDAEGTVTAGTSSPMTDGAAAVLVCTEDYADKNALSPLARIKSFAVAGCAPGIMGIGPVEATWKALRRAGLDIEDIDIIELNEAFASQAIACIRELGLSENKVNLDGGAIALGHPLGATGARIVGKTAALLARENARYGLATQCIGGGQGIATILERI
jgi:acetyl-CoA acyltransferase